MAVDPDTPDGPADADVPVNPDLARDDPMAAAVLAEGSGESGAAGAGDGRMLGDAIGPIGDDYARDPMGYGPLPPVPHAYFSVDDPDNASQATGQAAFGELGKEGTAVDPPHDGAASQAAGSGAGGEVGTVGDGSMLGDAIRMDDGASAPADGDDGADGWGAIATDDGAAAAATGSAALGDPLGIGDGTAWTTEDEGAAAVVAGSAGTDDPITAATDDYAPEAQAPDSMVDDDLLGIQAASQQAASAGAAGESGATDATDAASAEVTDGVDVPDDGFAAPAMAESMPVEDMSAPAANDWSAPAIDDPGTETNDDSALSDF
jgi:hypothetical protein